MIRKGTVWEQKYVASLIIKRQRGELLLPEEQAFLTSWAQRSPQHQATYDDLTDRESVLRKLQALLNADSTKKKRARSKQQASRKAHATGGAKSTALQQATISGIVRGKFSKRKEHTTNSPRSKKSVNH